VLDPKDALSHTALGLAFMERRDYSASLSEHQIALRLNPNSSLARWAFGYGLHRAERLEEALEQFDAALRLSPRDPGLWSYLTLKASTLYLLRQYEEAVRFAREAARHSTADLIWPYVHLAAALGQLSRTTEALGASRSFASGGPGSPYQGCGHGPITGAGPSLNLHTCSRVSVGPACQSNEARPTRVRSEPE
jgi:tetratricopeptide (TPR) repeat protein